MKYFSYFKESTFNTSPANFARLDDEIISVQTTRTPERNKLKKLRYFLRDGAKFVLEKFPYPRAPSSGWWL